MVPGVPGLPIPSVPSPAARGLRSGGDSVTVQPRPTVVETVRGMTLKTLSASLHHVNSMMAQVRRYHRFVKGNN